MVKESCKMRLAILTAKRNVGILINRRNYAGKHRCDAHMNELPIPCGPWDIWYADKQNYYNKVLAIGALWFFFSFGMLIYTNSMFLNFGPPAQPGPPSDMVEECEDLDT